MSMMDVTLCLLVVLSVFCLQTQARVVPNQQNDQANQIQAVGNVAGDPGFLGDFNEISQDLKKNWSRSDWHTNEQVIITGLLEGLAAAARDELVAATADTPRDVTVEPVVVVKREVDSTDRAHHLVKRGWLKKIWKKHKDHIVGGVISGVVSKGVVLALG